MAANRKPLAVDAEIVSAVLELADSDATTQEISITLHVTRRTVVAIRSGNYERRFADKQARLRDAKAAYDAATGYEARLYWARVIKSLT